MCQNMIIKHKRCPHVVTESKKCEGANPSMFSWIRHCCGFRAPRPCTVLRTQHVEDGRCTNCDGRYPRPRDFFRRPAGEQASDNDSINHGNGRHADPRPARILPGLPDPDAYWNDTAVGTRPLSRGYRSQPNMAYKARSQELFARQRMARETAAARAQLQAAAGSGHGIGDQQVTASTPIPLYARSRQSLSGPGSRRDRFPRPIDTRRTRPDEDDVGNVSPVSLTDESLRPVSLLSDSGAGIPDVPMH